MATREKVTTIKKRINAIPKMLSGGSPRATIWTYMLKESAITGSRGELGKPRVIMTQEVKSIAAVSPATLAIPKITLVTIPGAAAINVVRLIDFHFVAPNANAACLKDVGTMRNASSEPRMTIGRIIKARVSQPDRDSEFCRPRGSNMAIA